MTDARALVAAALLAIDGFSLLYIVYRTVIGLLGLRPLKPIAPGPGECRFLVLIPARDEEAVVGQTVRCVRELAYPPENVLLFVVADNCYDQTAARAEEASAS